MHILRIQAPLIIHSTPRWLHIIQATAQSTIAQPHAVLHCCEAIQTFIGEAQHIKLKHLQAQRSILIPSTSTCKRSAAYQAQALASTAHRAQALATAPRRAQALANAPCRAQTLATIMSSTSTYNHIISSNHVEHNTHIHTSSNNTKAMHHAPALSQRNDKHEAHEDHHKHKLSHIIQYYLPHL
jgi:hypothetical protein